MTSNAFTNPLFGKQQSQFKAEGGVMIGSDKNALVTMSTSIGRHAFLDTHRQIGRDLFRLSVFYCKRQMEVLRCTLICHCHGTRSVFSGGISHVGMELSLRFTLRAACSGCNKKRGIEEKSSCSCFNCRRI
jgi:hypothetical protein